jgi:hypothetical protein
VVRLRSPCAPAACRTADGRWAQPPGVWATWAELQHTAVSSVASGALGQIRWQTPVDTRPPYTASGSLLVHYGSPVVTQANTVIVPVKRRTTGGYQLVGFAGADARKLWRFRSNYRLPPHDWIPSFGPTISPNGTLWMPAAAGVLLRRGNLDVRGGARKEYVAFYGYDNYRHDRRTYMNTVFINTPLTAGSDGAVYFGFMVTGDNPLTLRAASRGSPTTAPARGSPRRRPRRSCDHEGRPQQRAGVERRRQHALRRGVGRQRPGHRHGYLLALDSGRSPPSPCGAGRIRRTVSTRRSTTTAPRRRWSDPTATSTSASRGVARLAPFPRLAPPLRRGARAGRRPGGFGWDDTPSVVPSSMVASYAGTSPYLLFVKYNDYAGAGGDGVNRIAVIDPVDQMLDPISGVPIMREVLTVAGPTPDVDKLPLWPNAVREWCINTGAVDPATQSILVNNEDGKLYRWSMATGTLSESIVLTAGLGEAYTPTLIGPDGTVYAINDAKLFAVGP